MDVIRILLADDHPVVRDGIRNRLDREADLTVVGEAANGEETIRQARRTRPDVVLLDVAMPGPGAVPVMEALRQAVPSVKVLVLSAFDDDEYVFGMLAAGATGYALKDERLSTIVEAVRAVSQGETWLSPRVAAKVARRAVGDKAGAEDSPLTDREQEVLRLMAQGKENAEIAAELVITERTVKFHVGNIYAKLGVTSRTAAVVEALRRGWVEV
jgi:DNA-binding NarL/FixJ family response regulator